MEHQVGYCVRCKVYKIKNPIEHKFYRYVDGEGKHWSGHTCPQCKSLQQKAYYRHKPSIKKPRFCKTCKGICRTKSPYCSTECKPKKSKQIRRYAPIQPRSITCKNCGIVFMAKGKRSLCKSNCKPLLEKICTCGKPFTTTSKQKTKCTPTCRVKKPRIPKACPICKAFTFRRKYCSSRCMRKDHRKPINKELLRKYKCISRKRRKLKCKAQQPKWVKGKDLLAVYAGCPEGFQVDHIIPLNHPDVSGLHCPDNMQYLSPSDNLRKSNEFDGTYHNNSWRSK